jgi:hypothetical protein
MVQWDVYYLKILSLGDTVLLFQEKIIVYIYDPWKVDYSHIYPHPF